MNKEEKPNSYPADPLMHFGGIHYSPNREGLEIGVPVVRLSNNILVANFSSPHTFEFEDGTVLPACSYRRARELAVDGQEIEISTSVRSGVQITDIASNWVMTFSVKRELERLSTLDGYDILLVPLSVMTAIKDFGLPIHRCRCVRKSAKGGKVLINKFCI